MYQEPLGFDLAMATPDRRRTRRRPHRRVRRPGERVILLGEPMDLVRPEEVMAYLDRVVVQGRRAVVANHNLHSLYLLRREPAMRRFYDLAEVVQVDSRPLLAFARLLGLPARGLHRSTYLDWRDHFWSLADRRGWRVAFVGGAEGVAATAAARLGERYRKVDLKVWPGFFDAAPGSGDNTRLLADLADHAPHVLMVGMGMPRQEAWVADHLEALPAAAILTVGAAFDYEAGAQRAAPRWMGAVGLEWLFRLAADPRRLFVRYCVEPWSLVGLALADLKAKWLHAAERRAGDQA